MEQLTIQDLDDLCVRLDRLAEQLTAHDFITMPVGREEQAADEAVQTIQQIGEAIAWAYRQHRAPGLGEAFAQPFVDRRSRDRLRDLLVDRVAKRSDARTRIAAQVLQTIHILLAATPPDSTLFCNLMAGFYLNDVAAAQLDFRDNVDLLPLWMTVVKDIAVMLSKDNIMLFFDPMSPTPFPIFSEAAKHYHHPVAQVRTHVQAVSLEIFLKLRDEDFWSEPLFQLVLMESATLFTHVCCLLREFWRMADEAFRHGVKRDLRSALFIQNDILMYLNDVFACDIPRLNEIVQEKLLRFAILPVLLRSLVLRRPSVTARGDLQQSDVLSPQVAMYLLYDLLSTMKNSPILETVASIFLRPELPEDAVTAVSSMAPRTPTLYYSVQASWGGSSRPGPFDRSDSPQDDMLYAMPPVTLVERLRRPGPPASLTRGWLVDALEEWLRSIDHTAEDAGLAGCLLGSCSRMLEAQRACHEALDAPVAERIGSALSQILAGCMQMQWPTLAAALRLLQDIGDSLDAPAARSMLNAPLKEKLLVPLAGEVQKTLKRFGREAQEAWAQEFHLQWFSRQALAWEIPEPTRQRERLEQIALQHGVPTAPPELSLREAREQCARTMLGAWWLTKCWARSDTVGKVVASDDMPPPMPPMPGMDAEDDEEVGRFQPGVKVYVGKMNRVKCIARGLQGGSQDQSLFLLPAKSMLVLVRPHDQKPFWAIPVIAEPLAMVRLRIDPQSAHHQPPPLGSAAADEWERTITIEVDAPRSPVLSGGASRQHSFDRLANTLGGPVPGGGPGPLQLAPGIDLLSVTAPMPQLSPLEGGASAALQGTVTFSLVFLDDRRKRVASGVLAQARHAVYSGMLEGLGTFLTEAGGG